MKRMSVFVYAVLAATLMFGASPAVGQYKQINLVSDVQGMALHTDPNLLDPWGLLFLPGGGFLIANAHSGLATVYGPHGQLIPVTVTVPPAPSQPFGPMGTPTGVLANLSSQFVISKDGKSGPALLLFDTLDGTISGWNPEVDPTNAIIVVDNSTKNPFPSSYTALAFAQNSKGQTVMYAADSGAGPTQSNNQIDMYDGNFQYLRSFTDPSAPSNMTVFGIEAISHKLYVTYAAFTLLQGGVVDVFDTDGNFLETFATNGSSGPLQEPWAITRAPDDFGQFSNALLIGNFEDGRINAFNPKTGKFLGQLADNHGTPISAGLGLWALGFRPGNHENRERNRLFFTSGINGEKDGLFGVIVATRDDDGTAANGH